MGQEEGVARYNNKVDIWSMGCILYKLALGKTPFNGDIAVYAYAHHQTQLIIPWVLPDSTTLPQCTELIRNMLERDWSRRHPVRDLIPQFKIAKESAIRSESGTSLMRNS